MELRLGQCYSIGCVDISISCSSLLVVGSLDGLSWCPHLEHKSVHLSVDVGA